MDTFNFVADFLIPVIVAIIGSSVGVYGAMKVFEKQVAHEREEEGKKYDISLNLMKNQIKHEYVIKYLLDLLDAHGELKIFSIGIGKEIDGELEHFESYYQTRLNSEFIVPHFTNLYNLIMRARIDKIDDTDVRSLDDDELDTTNYFKYILRGVTPRIEIIHKQLDSFCEKLSVLKTENELNAEIKSKINQLQNIYAKTEKNESVYAQDFWDHYRIDDVSGMSEVFTILNDLGDLLQKKLSINFEID